MRAVDFYTPMQLEIAEAALGLSFSNYTEKRKAILTTIHRYREGWIDENELEKKLSKIIKSR
jgi:hypothetical protein